MGIKKWMCLIASGTPAFLPGRVQGYHVTVIQVERLFYVTAGNDFYNILSVDSHILTGKKPPLPVNR